MIRSLGSILTSKIGITVVGIISTPVIVRLLSPTEYGHYASSLAILSFISVFAGAGLFDGMRHFIGHNTENQAGLNRIFTSYLLISLLISGIVFLLLVSLNLSGISDYILWEGSESIILIISGIFLFRSVYFLFRGSLLALEYSHISEALQFTYRLLFVAFGIGSLYLGKGVQGLLFGFVISGFICSTVGWTVSRHKFDLALKLKDVNIFSIKKYISFSFESTVLVLITTTLYNFDILLLSALTSGSATGQYKAALVVAEFIWFAPIAVQTVLLHSSAEMWESDSIERLSDVATSATNYTLAFSCLLVIGLYGLGSEFITIYFGEAYTAAVDPLLILLPGALCFSLVRPMMAISQASGSFRPLIIGAAIATSLNIILNILFIPNFGLVGAAAATSTSYSVMLFIAIWSSWKIGFNPVKSVDIAPILIASTIVFIALLLFRSQIQTRLLRLIIIPIIAATFYIFLLHALGFVNLTRARSYFVEK